MEILGAPILSLAIAIDRPSGFVAVRLTDVAPDGASLMVSYGLLNLTHRHGHEDPAAVIPGERFRIRCQLNDCAHAFQAGHKIRIAVSTNYWPLVMPSPEAVTMQVFTDEGSLSLPVRPATEEDDNLAAFPPAVFPPPMPRTVWRPMERGKRLSKDLGSGDVSIEVFKDRGHYRIDEIGLEVSGRAEESFTINRGDPLSARAIVEFQTVMARDEWKIETVLKTQLAAAPTTFVLTAVLEVVENSERIFTRTWSEEIDR